MPEAQNILHETVSRVQGLLDSPAPEIDLVGFGDSSIVFILRYWTNPRQPQVRQVQTKAIIAIKQALDEANISIPYPIPTLYYYNQEKYNDYVPNETSHNGHGKVDGLKSLKNYNS